MSEPLLKMLAEGFREFCALRPVLDRAMRHARGNPHLWLAIALFCIGAIALTFGVSPLAGALFGAGAALLGAWITELNSRRSAAEERLRRQSEPRRYLAFELQRVVDRVLYIHGRAIPNFVAASVEYAETPAAGSHRAPGDLKEDFLPYWPVLYPNAPQLHDLPGDDAAALVAFYDSLHFLAAQVNDWWQRDGQLPVNIFNMILHHVDHSLRLSLVCVEKLEWEKLIPPPYESWGTISSRVERSLSSATSAREHHLRRAEAKSGQKTQIQPPRP